MSAVPGKRCHLSLHCCYRTPQQTNWGAATQVVSMSPEGPNFHQDQPANHRANLYLATYPELVADEDTTKGGVGLETVLPSVVEEVNPFEEGTGGVSGAERL